MNARVARRCHSLFATYDLTEGQPNANNFVTDASGTLISTGGFGLFKGAKGRATFTAVFGQGIGFYVIDGKLSVRWARRSTVDGVPFARR